MRSVLSFGGEIFDFNSTHKFLSAYFNVSEFKLISYD